MTTRLSPAEDVLPSGVPGISQPIHELVLVVMGMPIFDNCDLDSSVRKLKSATAGSF